MSGMKRGGGSDADQRKTYWKPPDPPGTRPDPSNPSQRCASRSACAMLHAALSTAETLLRSQRTAAEVGWCDRGRGSRPALRQAEKGPPTLSATQLRDRGAQMLARKLPHDALALLTQVTSQPHLRGSQHAPLRRRAGAL
jgi:hypothetical protein